MKRTITIACFHLLLLVFLSAGISDFENLSTWRTELVSSAFCEVFIDMAITISIFISPMTNKFGKQVHLEEFTQMRLIKKKLVMPSRHHVKIMWQTKTIISPLLKCLLLQNLARWQLTWAASILTVTWTYNNLVMRDYVTNWKYIFTTPCLWPQSSAWWWLN